eukprot:COSAG06_NODE_1421_length_9512_cov_3.328482_4_plen_78_part_00
MATYTLTVLHCATLRCETELVLRVKAGKQSNVTKMEVVNKSDSAGDGRDALSPGTFEEEEGQKKKKKPGKGRHKKKR